jgi:hypothetical protein
VVLLGEEIDMKMTMALLAAGFMSFAGVAANAATYQLDDFLGSAEQSELSCLDAGGLIIEGCNGGGSNPDVEIAYLAELIGVEFSDLELDFKYETNSSIFYVDGSIDDINRQYFFDIADATGYFILKFGGGNGLGGVDTHYFFENIGELTKLVWNDDQTNGLLRNCEFGSEGGLYSASVGSCALSHITTVVPLPAAGWLLIGGLGGLAALRRRKKS